MKRHLGIWFVIVALTVGSASAALADFDAGLKAYDAGDFATALREWKPLAEQGDAGAQINLGLMYRNGQGVAQDYKQAVKWYRRAAWQGDAKAQFDLGVIYDSGLGVMQDYKQAFKWYRKAAEQGVAIAQTTLGFRYKKGTGVLSDKVLAHMWLNVAVANGDGFSAQDRARIEKEMTAAQVAEAQKLARQCMKKKFKGCGYE